MKSTPAIVVWIRYSVAPLVGAWIEIRINSNSLLTSTVAPLVGAWIEIPVSSACYHSRAVAPLVGAWIEMSVPSAYLLLSTSLPLWERGLKFYAEAY